MVISTYQAASGAGQAAMDELELQTSEVLQGKEVTKNIFPFQVRPLCLCLPFWACWEFPLPALLGLLGAPFACPSGAVGSSLCLAFLSLLSVSFACPFGPVGSSLCLRF